MPFALRLLFYKVWRNHNLSAAKAFNEHKSIVFLFVKEANPLSNDKFWTLPNSKDLADDHFNMGENAEIFLLKW